MKEKNKKPPTDEKFIEEDDDKRVIVFVAIAVLVIIGIIIGLLVGCQKEAESEEPGDEIQEPTSKDNEIIEDEVVNLEEEEKSVTTTVVKTTTKTEEKKKYLVTFYYNDNMNTHKVEVTEGEKVSPFVPEGYDSCEYYVLDNEFDFNTSINSKTEIVANCEIDEYTIIYNVESNDINNSNPSSYNVNDGDIELSNLSSSDQHIFAGWYTDSTYTNRITNITPSIIDLANSDKEINLYAKFVTEFEYSVINDTGEKVLGETITYTDASVTITNINNSFCTLGGNHLGWTTTENSKSISYTGGETVVLTGDLTLYPVCGTTTIVYVSEGEVVDEVGITEEELEDYDLPDEDDLDLTAPIYYLPVEEETTTSKEVVEDETEDIRDDQIKISDVEAKAAEGYTPLVGDNVEEIEKVLDGWTTEDTVPESDTFGEQVEVPEDYTPPEDSRVELNAEWVEPIQYVTGISG